MAHTSWPWKGGVAPHVLLLLLLLPTNLTCEALHDGFVVGNTANGLLQLRHGV